ncbi:MAG TPA: hypothetical protein VLF60_04115 [Candidatus Saccharimonadales bacterium]|nr:hypothetical protein [Candidatus Saccharimonadales bacterium]
MATTITSNDQLIDELDPIPYIYRFSYIELLRVALTGAILGLLVPLVASPISRFIIEPFFCRSENSFSFCAQGGALAFGISLIILSVGSLLVLASLRTYQPLINVLAPLATLWGLDQYVETISGSHKPQFWLISALLFGLAYALFYLLLRIRYFIASLVLIVLVVVVVRLQF